MRTLRQRKRTLDRPASFAGRKRKSGFRYASRFRGTRLLFGLTIFLSAFMLFQVELIMGKFVLPRFGGAPAVWTTCMFVFQALLLAGYLYAHVLSLIGSERVQVRLHVLVLVVSVLILLAQNLLWSSPITPGMDWQPESSQPIRHIVSLLVSCIGLPFLLLASTGPLLQRWFAYQTNGASPYRFFAISNIGSLLGLLSYPMLVEPYLPLAAEEWFWLGGYFLFSIATLACARSIRKDPSSDSTRLEMRRSEVEARGHQLSWGVVLLWFGLAACASLMLLATTNIICQDVAAVPLLWVLPLSLYLFTFIVSFANEEWYRRGWVHPTLALACFAAYVALSPWSALIQPTAKIVIFSATLFLCCLGCHGELGRLRPAPRHLTSFYLIVAAGGWAGGLASSLVAPLIFPDFWEFHLGLWGTVTLIGVVLIRDKQSWLYVNKPWLPLVMLSGMISLRGRVALALLVPVGLHLAGWQALALSCLGLAALYSAMRNEKTHGTRRGSRWTPVSVATLLILLTWGLMNEINAHPANRVMRTRDFYGMLTIEEQHPDNPQEDAYELHHGGTLHGLQFVNPGRRREPTSYYGEQSGLALALRYHARRLETPPRALRVGVIGLGVGTVAAHAQEGDYLRFYEIDPEVVRLSASDHPYFTFIRDSNARADVVLGDARISLRREAERGDFQRFDVLVVDAFQGDAVPVHLLTREAFRLYLTHMRWPNGMLVINVSNRSLDLEPVISGVAQYFGLQGRVVHSVSRDDGLRPNHWIVLFKNDEMADSPITTFGRPVERSQAFPLWTDQYTDVFTLLR